MAARTAVFSLGLTLVLAACGGGGTEENTGPAVRATISELELAAQKGPFDPGASVRVWPLGPDGAISRSRQVDGQLDARRRVMARLPWTGPSLVEVEGGYFSELTGQPGLSPVTLRAVVDAERQSEGRTNVNLFTHLLADRTRSLMQSQGMTYAAAFAQARGELRSSVEVRLSDGIGPSALDLTDGVGEHRRDNAVLLLFSGLLLKAGGGDVGYLQNVAAEFEASGGLTQSFDALCPHMSGLALDELANNLSALSDVQDAPDSGDLDPGSLSWCGTAAPPAPNREPVAIGDAVDAIEDQELEIDVATQVLANDRDADSDPLTATPTAATSVAGGSITDIGNGRWRYRPPADFNGSDVFAYRLTDGRGGSSNALVDIDVQAVNDPPVAVADGAILPEGGAVTVDVLANDSDVDDGLDPTSVVVSRMPANGAVTVDAQGQITYAHDGSETITDSLEYRVSDLAGAASQAVTLGLTITAANDAPVLGDDTGVISRGNSVVLSLLGNDSDPDGSLDSSSIRIVQPPAHGTLVVGVGTVQYTHSGNAETSDSFRYTVADDAGLEGAGATVTLTIIATPNLPPVGADDTGTVLEGDTVVVNVVANDSDPEGQLDPDSVVVVGQPLHGTVSVEAGGTLRYTHDGSDTSADSLRYTVADTAGITSAPVTVGFTVQPANDPPTAVGDSLTATEDIARDIELATTLLSNDSDPDGDSLTASIVGGGATREGGQVTVVNAGRWRYTPPQDFAGSDSFDYRVEDPSGESAVATVTIDVAAADDVPVANPDSAQINRGDSVTLDVLANDTGLGDGGITVTTPGSSNATVSVQPNQSVSYVSDGVFFGNDSFSYTVRDTDGSTAVGTITIQVDCAGCGSARLTWLPPTTNTDDSPLTDLSGYLIFIGNAPGSYGPPIVLNDADAREYTFNNLDPGTYYFAVKAVNSAGASSAHSNEDSKTF